MSATLKNKFSQDNLLLFSIIAIATILRFWNFSEIPFMYDELSGLFRAQSITLSEVISQTKETDVHPIGIPIFIHYWTIVFGNSEQAVKFPFIIFGLCSLFFTYKIAKKWFNATVGLITVAFMATFQYTTIYGQLARPYASGIFFSVLMVWFWTIFFTETENKKQNKNLIGFIICATLCAYNHYFSLLFALIVGVSGLFFITKQNALHYFLSGVCIAILYIPQFPVFFHHFSIGGATENDWLTQPHPDWFWVFVKYLFHYSRLVYALVLLVVVVSFLFVNKTLQTGNKYRLIALAWGILPFLIAYFYSVYKNPVLQFSTLIFSMPFLLIFVFSFYKDVTAPVKTGILAIIIGVNVYTLAFEREHFRLFYHQPYEEMYQMSDESLNTFGKKNVTVALKITDGFMDYYFKKNKGDFSFYRIGNEDPKNFRDYLERQCTRYFIAGNLPLEYLQLVKIIYPYIIKKEEGFSYNIYCFAKEQTQSQLYEPAIFSSNTSDEKLSGFWSADAKGLIKMDSINEYSPAFTAKLTEITKGKHAILNVTATISPVDSFANPVLVIDVHDGEELLVWRGGEYNWFKNKKRNTDFIYVSQLISEIDLLQHPNAKIKIYIWNKNKKSFNINNMQIETIKSNPYIYGLFAPL